MSFDGGEMEGTAQAGSENFPRARRGNLGKNPLCLENLSAYFPAGTNFHGPTDRQKDRSMKRTPVLALISAAFLAGCASVHPPSQMDDACSILRDQPVYWRATRAAEKKWGVPISVQLAIIHQESRFKRDARPPKKYFLWVIPAGRVSSAYGYAQALDGTWDDYKKSTGRHWVSRSDIADAADFIGWYGDQAHRRAGISKSDARSLYLAYHEGIGGYSSGSFKSKGWLLGVASKLETRAHIYARQIRRCGLH